MYFILDIKDGNLKSILGLFFNLSRYKQQQKALQQQQHNLNQNTPSTTATPTVNSPASSRITSPSSQEGAVIANSTVDNNVNNAVNNANTTAESSLPLDNVKSNMSSR